MLPGPGSVVIGPCEAILGPWGDFWISGYPVRGPFCVVGPVVGAVMMGTGGGGLPIGARGGVGGGVGGPGFGVQKH